MTEERYAEFGYEPFQFESLFDEEVFYWGLMTTNLGDIQVREVADFLSLLWFVGS